MPSQLSVANVHITMETDEGEFYSDDEPTSEQTINRSSFSMPINGKNGK